jgi:hypothetical protein
MTWRSSVDEEHIPILTLPRLYNKRGQLIASMASVYYYQGNIHHPYDLLGDRIGKVKRAVTEFINKNKERIEKDRSHPDYKTLVQLYDEQMRGFN